MAQDNEYEVETIVKAKVFMRGKKMGWKFHVKWKGYGQADNTWEPERSFEGSGDEIIQKFWDRVDTQGRDIGAVEGWTNGEEVYPTGPPRRRRQSSHGKGKAPSPVDEPPPVEESPSKETRKMRAKRPLEVQEAESPPKRRRAASSRRKSGTRTPQAAPRETHTPVPDSEEELVLLESPARLSLNGKAIDGNGHTPLAVKQTPHTENTAGHDVGDEAPKPKRRGRPPKSAKKANDAADAGSSSLTAVAIEVDALMEPPTPLTVEEPPPERGAPSASSSARTTRRVSKGRDASLLTFSKEKGGLHTMRRKKAAKDEEAARDAVEVAELLESASAPIDSVVFTTGSSNVEIALHNEEKVPTAAELLRLAGTESADARSLPDFEDDSHPSASPTVELPDKMPTAISFPESASSRPSLWSRSTIFGPLSLGAGPSGFGATSPSDVQSPLQAIQPFLLTLNNETAIPLALKDVSTAATSVVHIDRIAPGSQGPPGKLYKSDAAVTLLGTLQAEGSCARLTLDGAADGKQRQAFEMFCNRLEEGGLFIAMAGPETLACCSSSNQECTEKLSVADALRGLPGAIVVTHVKIANYPAFADAAVHAETVCW
ncbi:hypothetical protein BC834DRAFT_855247 [Gloeopeniophorella convolvens]|nr:hypothetical protein BC834DRAFT_855247 [Gloeopeniophorella convolvens]